MAEPRDYSRIPLGNNVARVFPWWRQGTLLFPQNTPANSHRHFTFGPNNAPLKNNLNVPVNIKEIRLLAPVEDDEVNVPWSIVTSVRMKHPRYDIFNRWMPIQSIQTEDDQFHFGNSAMAVIPLPAPYFLQFGQTFMIEIRSDLPNFAAASYRTIDVCLRGWDPDNDFPMVLSKESELPAVAGNPVTITFDENRDSAIRSAWITDIAFSFTDADSPDDYLQDTQFYFEIRIKSTAGPEWHDHQWIRLIGVSRFAGVLDNSGADVYRPLIIYRPITPHILRPEEEMRIEILNQTLIGALNEDERTHYCWVIGEQEGANAMG